MATLVDLVTLHGRDHLAPSDIANCASCSRACRTSATYTLSEIKTAVYDIRDQINAVDNDNWLDHWKDDRAQDSDDDYYGNDYYGDGHVIERSSTLHLYNCAPGQTGTYLSTHSHTHTLTANSIDDFAKQPLTELHIRKYFALQFESGIYEQYSETYNFTPLALARSLRTLYSQCH